MNLDTRQLAWLIQIAALGAVILVGLWLSPAAAATIPHSFPLGALLSALRATIGRTHSS